MTTGAWKSRRRGATVLEAALTLPVLLLTVLGIIQFGSVFFTRHNMLHAARVGARHYAVGDGDAASAEQAARDLLESTGISYPSLNVSVTPPPPNEFDVTCTVSVSADDAALGDPLLLMGEEDVVSVQVVMRDEREVGN